MPEAPLVPAELPHLITPPSLAPPEIGRPEVPTNELRLIVDAPNADQLAAQLAAAVFAQENPHLREWENRRPGTVKRQAAYERKAARLERIQDGLVDYKVFAGEREQALGKSILGVLQQPALLLMSFLTLASALNVAAVYVIDAGAWTVLVEHPWMAFPFVFLAPAAGIAGVFGIASRLDTDRSQKWFGIALGILTLMAWAGWLIELERLYSLQTMIGDAAGRRLPEGLADADSNLHGGLLLTQLLAEVLSGATFKLMSTRAHRRMFKDAVVTNPVLVFVEKKWESARDAEGNAAAAVGRIDDFSRNYEKGLADFSVRCLAEMGRIRASAQSAAAAARAGFLSSDVGSGKLRRVR